MKVLEKSLLPFANDEHSHFAESVGPLIVRQPYCHYANISRLRDLWFYSEILHGIKKGLRSNSSSIWDTEVLPPSCRPRHSTRSLIENYWLQVKHVDSMAHWLVETYDKYRGINLFTISFPANKWHYISHWAFKGTLAVSVTHVLLINLTGAHQAMFPGRGGAANLHHSLQACVCICTPRISWLPSNRDHLLWWIKNMLFHDWAKVCWSRLPCVHHWPFRCRSVAAGQRVHIVECDGRHLGPPESARERESDGGGERLARQRERNFSVQLSHCSNKQRIGVCRKMRQQCQK